ncbi:Alpha/Beta hydrolase protein [Aspergillus varians]
MDTYNTKEGVLKLGIINPELEEALRHTTRQMLSEMEKATYDSCPRLDTQESVTDIPMRDGYVSQLHITKSANSSSANPLVVLIFGGGFVMGTNIQSIVWARTIAALYGATVVQPSYRLAPEHKFPTAPNDIWDSVQWVVANAPALDTDLTKWFVLGGRSAGGNISIVTAHRAVKEKLSPPITGMFASIPVCISKETVPEKYKDLWVSREQNANSPGSPGLDSKNVAGLDGLRDDGLVYAKVLRDNGVDVKFDAYPGVPHGHFNIWPHWKQSIKSQGDMIWHVGWLLGREVSRERVAELLAVIWK